MTSHAGTLIALAVGGLGLAIGAVRSSRANRGVRNDAAEQLFWWGATHGLSAPLPGAEDVQPVSQWDRETEHGWSPLDAALRLNGASIEHTPGVYRDPTAAGLAMFVERATLGHSADRVDLLGAVRGPLCGYPNGAVVAITAEDRDEDRNSYRWVPRFHCTAVLLNDVAPRVSGLVISRRRSSGGLPLKLDPSLVEVQLESTELAEHFHVAAPPHADQIEVRACLTPAVQTWIVDAGPDLIELRGSNLQIACVGHFTEDAQFDGLVAAAGRIAQAMLARPVAQAA